MKIRDDGLRYGLVTRVLHWGIAGLLLYQLGGVVAGAALGETPLTEAWGSSHKTVGGLLFVLAVLRALWGLYNLATRPTGIGGLVGRLAGIGHLVLYGLMLAVPALALLRQYGSGRAYEVFGLTIMQGEGERIEWMMAPARAYHGLLGWILLVAVLGHIIMALVHHFVLKDDTLRRMAG